MNWIEFKNQMFGFACFSTNQVYAWKPRFDRNNLGRWLKRGYLVRLRRGLYAFPEYLEKPGMALYFAGRIYAPSYISLHTALSSYGLIPESVLQITSVTSLKTAGFSNDFGDYSYKSVRSDLMFGYVPWTVADGRTVSYATREKALLDLFYLYPFYNTRSDIADLRLDSDLLHEDLDCRLLEDFTVRYGSAAVERRVRLFREVHHL